MAKQELTKRELGKFLKFMEAVPSKKLGDFTLIEKIKAMREAIPTKKKKSD